jgi:porin
MRADGAHGLDERTSARSLPQIFMIALAAGLSSTASVPSCASAEPSAPAEESLWKRGHLLPDWLSQRSRLEDVGMRLGIDYTGDYMANVHGGLARKGEYLGNLDVTLAWNTRHSFERDLGTLFLYGLFDHGGRPTQNVGDAQFVDNIEAPDSAKIYEAWWEKTLFSEYASLLLGLYDVNSEFYALDSAGIFINSSFGIGAALGNSGVNGPSIFPTTSLGARLKVEPAAGYEFQTAVLDGVPGDPNRPKGTRIEFNHGDGVFVIAEIARRWSYLPVRETAEDSGREKRRHVRRLEPQPPNGLRIAAGAWLYTGKIPHVSQTDPNGQPEEHKGHPGAYLIAEIDAERISALEVGGLTSFLQLGWADGDVQQFAGYVGTGVQYTGLIPGRPMDSCGFGVAAAFNGDAYKDAARAQGESPSDAEVALEWTYEARLTPWLSLQGDLQYVIDPGGLNDRPDAVVVGLRYQIRL